MVLDADGNPVEGAFVTVVWGTAPTPEIARRTSADGSFGVGLPAGRFRVRAVAADGRAGEIQVEGGEGSSIVIRLGRRGQSS